MVFELVRRLAPGVVVLRCDGDQAIWTLKRLRKDTRCAGTNLILRSGERHFGPVGNQLYRWARLCREFVDSL